MSGVQTVSKAVLDQCNLTRLEHSKLFPEAQDVSWTDIQSSEFACEKLNQIVDLPLRYQEVEKCRRFGEAERIHAWQCKLNTSSISSHGRGLCYEVCISALHF